MRRPLLAAAGVRYLIERAHEVLISVQDRVNELDKFTVNLEDGLHEQSWHLRETEQKNKAVAFRHRPQQFTRVFTLRSVFHAFSG